MKMITILALYILASINSICQRCSIELINKDNDDPRNIDNFKSKTTLKRFIDNLPTCNNGLFVAYYNTPYPNEFVTESRMEKIVKLFSKLDYTCEFYIIKGNERGFDWRLENKGAYRSLKNFKEVIVNPKYYDITQSPYIELINYQGDPFNLAKKGFELYFQKKELFENLSKMEQKRIELKNDSTYRELKKRTEKLINDGVEYRLQQIKEEENKRKRHIETLVPQDGFTIWKCLDAKMAYLVYPNGDYRKINPFSFPYYSNDAKTTFSLIKELLNAPIMSKKIVFKTNAVYIGDDSVFVYAGGSNLYHTRILKGENILFECTKIPSAFALRVKEGKFFDLGNGKAKIVWEQNDSKYEGDVKDGIPNGYGVFEGHLSVFNYIRTNGKTLKYSGYWSNGRFHGNGSLVNVQLVANSGNFFDLGGEDILVELTGKFVDGKRDGKFIIKNYNTNDLKYRAAIDYKDDKLIAGKLITDEYYEERLANEAKRYKETIDRMNNAKSTGKFFIMDKRDAYDEKYTCKGNEYKYKVYPIKCNCMVTTSYYIYYWSGACGYKAGYYSAVSFDTDTYLGATEIELESTLKSKCGCN